MKKPSMANMLVLMALVSTACPATFAEDAKKSECSDKKTECKTEAKTECSDKSECKSGKTISQAESKLPKISRADLKEKLSKVTLVNALEPKFFDRSRIKGSLNLADTSNETNVSKLLPNKEAEIVVYCMNTKCHASDRVADSLAAIGYKNVSIYREGLKDWIAAGFELEGSNPKDPVPPQATAENKESAQSKKNSNEKKAEGS